jgi:hypothetical protein
MCHNAAYGIAVSWARKLMKLFSNSYQDLLTPLLRVPSPTIAKRLLENILHETKLSRLDVLALPLNN